MASSLRLVFSLVCCLLGVCQGVLLPFLETPKHDGVKRVCHLTAENFTTVVNTADISVVVFDGPQEGVLPSICPTDVDKFAELTAQVLRKKNIAVCRAATAVGISHSNKPGDILPLDNDVFIYKKGSGKPYYGRLSTSALLGFLFKVNNTRVNIINGKLDKIAFDAAEETKVVGFFMQGAADYLAFESAAASMSPLVLFYATFDRVVARHLKLDFVGQILLLRPLSKIPVSCPQNPASASDIETFITLNKGALLTKIDKQNMYDPKLLDSTRMLVLAVGEQYSPVGGYFFHLVTRLARNNTGNVDFQKLNILWVEPQIFPTIYLMMEELEATLGIPNKLPAFGAVNVTTLQSAWMDTTTLNVTADWMADEQNLQLLQEFLNNVITNTIIAVRLGQQSFVQTPSSQVVLEGTVVTLECVIENPEGDCLWLKDGRNIGFNLARYPHYSWRGNRAVGDCSLVISAAQLGRDDGEWTCEITGGLDSPTLSSPPAKLVVAVIPTPKSEL